MTAIETRDYYRGFFGFLNLNPYSLRVWNGMIFYFLFLFFALYDLHICLVYLLWFCIIAIFEFHLLIESSWLSLISNPGTVWMVVVMWTPKKVFACVGLVFNAPFCTVFSLHKIYFCLNFSSLDLIVSGGQFLCF